MPPPVIHAVLSSSLYKEGISDSDLFFIIGSVLPDACFTECNGFTSLPRAPIEEFINEGDAFMKGVFFHSLCDGIWEKYLLKSDLGKRISSGSIALKSFYFVGDDLFYDRFIGWGELLESLGSDLFSEKIASMCSSDEKRWFLTLSEYLSSHPTGRSRRLLMDYARDPSLIVDVVNDSVIRMKENKEIKDLIFNGFSYIKRQLKEKGFYLS